MSSLTRAAARGMLVLTVAHAGLMGAGYVTAVILAQGLGPALYGVYGIIYSLLLGAELIGRLGVPQALSKLIAETPDRSPDLERTGVTITAIVYCGLFLLFWAASPSLAHWFRVEDGASLFRLAALDIPFYGIYFACNHILNGRRNFGAEALGVSLYAASKVVGIVALFLTDLSVAAALLVNVFASIVALGFVVSRLGWAAFRPTLAVARPLIRLAVPIGLFAGATQVLLSIDLWALNAVGAGIRDEIKGLYVAATNVARLPNIISFVTIAVLIPSISRALGMNDNDAVRRSVRGTARYLAVVLLPAAGLITVEADRVLELLFSSAYRDGAPLLRILIFSHGVLYTLLVTDCAILIAAGYARVTATTTLLLLPVALVLNIVLIHAAGATGAAMAALLTMALGTAATGTAVHRTVAPVIAPRTLFLAILAAGLTTALAAVIHTEGWLLLIELAGLAVVYLAILAGLGVVGRADLEPFVAGRGRGSAATAPE